MWIEVLKKEKDLKSIVFNRRVYCHKKPTCWFLWPVSWLHRSGKTIKQYTQESNDEMWRSVEEIKSIVENELIQLVKFEWTKKICVLNYCNE